MNDIIINPNWLLQVRIPNIIVNPFLREQYRLPVHRKSKVLKRWAKRNENYRADTKIYKTKDAFICSPSMENCLLAQLREQGYAVQFPIVT